MFTALNAVFLILRNTPRIQEPVSSFDSCETRFKGIKYFDQAQIN